MAVHIQTMRSYGSVALGLMLAVFLIGQTYPPRSEDSDLAAVTGRVTCGDHPLDGTWVVFEEDAPRGHMSYGQVRADGSFRAEIWGGFGREGAVPGTYRVRFTPTPQDAPRSPVDARYMQSGTSGILVHVEPGWNRFVITLPDPGRGPTQAQHLWGEARAHAPRGPSRHDAGAAVGIESGMALSEANPAHTPGLWLGR